MFKTVIALTAAAVFTTAAHADNFRLRIGAGHPTQVTYVGVTEEYFVSEVEKRVKEKTSHTVRFIKAWAGTVAKLDGISEAVEKGILDIGLAIPGFEQSRLPLLNFGNYFPFTQPDHIKHAEVANRMLKEVPALQKSVDQYGIKLLNLSVTESYGLTLKDDYTGLSGMAGKKLACAGTNAPWALAVDAVPVQLPIGENYQGLQTGLIDGNIALISFVPAFRLHEVVKTFVKTGFGPVVAISMIMNQASRDKLPKEVQGIIDEVSYETSLRIAEVSQKRDQTAEEASKKLIKVIELPPADKKQWAESLKGLPGKAAKELDGKGLPGTETFKTYVKFVNESGHKFPVEYPL